MREICRKTAAVCSIAVFFLLMIPVGILFLLLNLLEPVLCKLAQWISERK